MSDRDDFAELVGSARAVTKSPEFYFAGRIRYGTKGEKLEERLLCMNAFRVYICSTRGSVKIESQFNILAIKSIERVTESHVIIEADEKQTYALYGLHDKSSIQPFLVILVRNLHAVFPHRLQAIVEIRPENEYDKLVRSSNEYFEETKLTPSDIRPCGGFSLRYECACDFYQTEHHRWVKSHVDTVFAHRTSREFTFREFETLPQKDWLPIISALRHNEWFTKITIDETKLSSENFEELCTVSRLSKTIKDLHLVNCNLKHDFCTRFAHGLSVSPIEHLDLSYNTIEDKGLIGLTSYLQQRKLPLRSLCFQSCSITHKGLHPFSTAIVNNTYLSKHLQVLNLSGNRIKEENCITLLCSNPENALEELHLSDIEFSLESFFHSLASMSCKLRRLFISSVKASGASFVTGGVKSFFTKTSTLELLQLSNANLSNDFLRELCEGLHSNSHLNKLDLRLSGNPLEAFIRDHAVRFASIPSLASLDVTGCDIDNEIPTLLNELKRHRQLKSLYIGKNFNNIKNKNMQKVIDAMVDMIVESGLESLSLGDSKLKENMVEILKALANNTSLKNLDIRGNSMGDGSVRVLTRILRINRHLHTVLLDRNLLSLNNLEEIVDAMNENSVIQYFPVPITDIILMKTTEKDRMEKLQQLISKLDSICTRNQQAKDKFPSDDALIVTNAANLARDINRSSSLQELLVGDQASLDYMLSCVHRPNRKNEELRALLDRTARLAKISSDLHEIYIDEEQRLKDEWNRMCRKFEEKFAEGNERLSKKFYQLFKEQSAVHYDDKLQEQVRSCFADSKGNVQHLLNDEIPARLTTYSRECYINLVACLQKRAYETTNEQALDMHERLESTLLQLKSSPQHTSSTDGGSSHAQASTLERLVARTKNAVLPLAHKQNHVQPDAPDEVPVTSRAMKRADSNECLTDLPTNGTRSTARENRLLTPAQNKGPAPVSPKPPLPSTTANWRRSVIGVPNEHEPLSTLADAVHNNIPGSQNRLRKKELVIEDEGDLIEHDLLDLVEQEQLKERQQQQQQHHHHRASPPPVPMKKRVTSMMQESALDIPVEPMTKLVHPGRDRPRRANVKRPVRRATNGGTCDSSSDGGLDNDDASIEDPVTPITNDVPVPADTEPSDSSAKAMAKVLKSGPRTPRTPIDEAPPVAPKQTVLQARSSAGQFQTQKSNHESPQLMNSDSSHDYLQAKPSASLIPSSRDEAREANNTSESLLSPPTRPIKTALGTRVLPALDANGDAPPVRLRHFQIEKKDSLVGAEVASAPGDASENGEEYKQMSVKERARMLTTTNAPINEKKTPPLSNSTGALKNEN